MNLLVNFGGPRSLSEIAPFLTALLTDQEVVRTRLPSFLHRLLFTRIAKKRAVKVAVDYIAIGGKSPLFEDTEAIATSLEAIMNEPFITFHRYLPTTHSATLEKIRSCSAAEIRVFPLFPQFSCATTGSVAHFFARSLPKKQLERLRWVRSYATHPTYIAAFEKVVRGFLNAKGFEESQTLLLYSAHGVPQSFVDEGDTYEIECQNTFKALSTAFPQAGHKLAYQSQFGKGLWLQPSTGALCSAPQNWASGYQNVVVVPLSFTSDHLETLFEVEQQYLPPLRSQGLRAERCPALNLFPEWIAGIAQILKESPLVPNHALLRSVKASGNENVR